MHHPANVYIEILVECWYLGRFRLKCRLLLCQVCFWQKLQGPIASVLVLILLDVIKDAACIERLN
jgi:hypothetical protein